MKKLIEHTYGLSIYMKLKLDNGYIAEVNEYFRNDGTIIKTTADNDPELRKQVIAAYNKLY